MANSLKKVTSKADGGPADKGGIIHVNTSAELVAVEGN